MPEGPCWHTAGVAAAMSSVDEIAPSAEVPLRRNRDFLLLWSGAGCTLIGASAGQIAYPFLVLSYTRSAELAGLVQFVAMLPNLLVQLPAGALVDRWNRRTLMIACDVGSILATGSVTLAVLAGHVWLPQVMVVAFIEGSLAIPYQLAERAAVRHLVPSSQLPAALTRNEARWRAAGLLGRPIGGLLYGFAGWSAFLFISLTHLVSLACLLLIRRNFEAERARKRQPLIAGLVEGLVWTWQQRFLRTVVGLIGATNVLFAGLSLTVIVIVQHSGRSAAVAGLITAAGGLGGTFGALHGNWWQRRANLRTITLGGMAVWCVLMPLISFVRNPFLLAAIFPAMSYVGGVMNVAIGVYQVRTTPDSMQGRASSVLMLIGIGAGSTGAPIAGFALDAVGITITALGIGGAICFLTLLGRFAIYRHAPDM
ncbi:MAG TPA: MFS transporter [Streptosporangiaceae bacterium]